MLKSTRCILMDCLGSDDMKYSVDAKFKKFFVLDKGGQRALRGFTKHVMRSRTYDTMFCVAAFTPLKVTMGLPLVSIEAILNEMCGSQGPPYLLFSSV
jgi:hypothetical protein